MPGARILKMVVMMLIEPTMEDTPKICNAKIVMSVEMPPCTESGAYIVHPPATAPPGTKIEATNKIAAGISNQKLILFKRGNAISGAPTISGTCQLAKPTNAGIIAPKIMIRPCNVVSLLNCSGSTNCRPGWNNSARMPMAIAPANINIVKLNQRYMVPMSL